MASRSKSAELLEKLNTSFAAVLLVAPTLIAPEMQAGKLMPWAFEPFPVAMTVAMPAERRELIALVIAGETLSHDWEYTSPPKLMLTDAMG